MYVKTQLAISEINKKYKRKPMEKSRLTDTIVRLSAPNSFVIDLLKSYVIMPRICYTTSVITRTDLNSIQNFDQLKLYVGFISS